MQALQREQSRALASSMDMQVNRSFEELYYLLNQYTKDEVQDQVLRDLLSDKIRVSTVLERVSQTQQLSSEFKQLVFAAAEVQQNSSLLDQFIRQEQQRQPLLEEERQRLLAQLDRWTKKAQSVPNYAQIFKDITEYNRLTKKSDRGQQLVALEEVSRRVASIKEKMRATIDQIRSDLRAGGQ